MGGEAGGVKLVKIQQNIDALLCVDFNPMYIVQSSSQRFQNPLLLVSSKFKAKRVPLLEHLQRWSVCDPPQQNWMKKN